MVAIHTATVIFLQNSRMRREYDFLIVGSGLMGATFAHLMHKAGKRCLVVERRSHKGGNLFCQEMEGIQVHQYGAHILHTNNATVWKLVENLVPMNRYTNSPLANYCGELFNLPFNMNTFHQMWGVRTPEEAQQKLQEQRRKGEVRNLEEQALSLVGKDIYEKLIKGYTEKQWGRPCSELPAFIIRRLPLRFVYDNNYFNDSFQGIPIGGYNRLIEGLLEGTEVQTECDFLLHRNELSAKAEHIFYTGPLDAFFNYRLGALQYRTVRFKTEILDMPNFQGNAVVNYTDKETPWTRIIEHKHFESFGEEVYQNPKTVVSWEFSEEWKAGMEPYYPVNDTPNTLLQKEYQQLAEQEKNVIFAGRLAEYKYYDMAPTMERAMQLAENYLAD